MKNKNKYLVYITDLHYLMTLLSYRIKIIINSTFIRSKINLKIFQAFKLIISNLFRYIITNWM